MLSKHRAPPSLVGPAAPALIPPLNLHLCNYKKPHVKSDLKIHRFHAASTPCCLNRFSSVVKKDVGLPVHCFSRDVESKRLYGDDIVYSQKKLSRLVVARSEIAGAGARIPDANYQLAGPRLVSKVRGVLFYVVTAISAIPLFLLMMVVHPFVLLFDRHRRKAQFFVAKVWAILTVLPFFKIEIDGLENMPAPDTPAVYVSNHQSFLDVYTLLTVGRSFKFISKTGIFLFPVIGWAMLLMGVIPLRRMDSRSQLECLKRCMDLVRKGASVFFFPEGTRSRDGKLGTFKKGAFSVATKTGVPVVPITLVGTGKIMPTGMEGIVNQGSIRVIIHKPIEGREADELCNQAREVIANELDFRGRENTTIE